MSRVAIVPDLAGGPESRDAGRDKNTVCVGKCDGSSDRFAGTDEISAYVGRCSKVL